MFYQWQKVVEAFVVILYFHCLIFRIAVSYFCSHHSSASCNLICKIIIKHLKQKVVQRTKAKVGIKQTIMIR